MINLLCYAYKVCEPIMEVADGAIKLTLHLQVLGEPGTPQRKPVVCTMLCPADRDLAGDITDEIRHCPPEGLKVVVGVKGDKWRVRYLVTKRFKLKVEAAKK